jgi:rRNA biogenesis protein RRP5
VVKGELVLGEVVSVEDKGWDIRLSRAPSQRALLKTAAVPSEVRPRLLPGRPVLVTVQSVGGVVVGLSWGKGGVGSAVTLAQVLPGMTVSHCVQAPKQPSDGWRLVFGSKAKPHSVAGDVHWTHLAKPGPELPPWDPDYNTAVIIWVDNDRAACGLSLRPHLLKRQPLRVTSPKATSGSVVAVTNANVWLSVEGKYGLAQGKALLEEEGKQAIKATFRRGQRLPFRQLTDTPSQFDGTIRVAVAPNMLAAKWLRRGELQQGEACMGKVESLTGKKGAIVILEQSEGRIRAFIPAVHMPSAPLALGNKVECRLWKVDPQSKNLPILSAKKRIVKKPVAPPVLDEWTAGVVVGLQKAFAIVSLLGGVEAVLPASQLSFAAEADARVLLKLGQVVKVRITQWKDDRCVLSLLEGGKKKKESKAAPPTQAMGEVVSGTVVHKTEAGAELLLADGKTRALLPIQQMSDWPRLAGALFEELKVEDQLENLVVWGTHHHYQLIVSAKYSYQTLKDALPRSLAELKVGTEFPAAVLQKVGEYGVIVRIWGDMPMMCKTTNLIDEYVDVKNTEFDLSLNKSLCGKVIAVDNQGRVEVGLSQKCQPADLGYFLQAYLAQALPQYPPGLAPGCRVQGVVTATGKFGATLRIKSSDLMEYEGCCGPQFAQSWRVGQTVKVAVVDIDPCSRPALLDVIPDQVWSAADPWRVLLVKDEVTVISTDEPDKLGLLLTQAEWAQHLKAHPALPHITGQVVDVSKSQYESPSAQWTLFNANADELQAKTSTSELTLGQRYQVVVVSVVQHHINVKKVVGGEKGRIHISELCDDESQTQVVMNSFKAGDELEVVYIGCRERKEKSALMITHAHQTKESLNYHFSLRLSLYAGQTKTVVDNGVWLAAVPVFSTVNKNDTLMGVITEHSVDGLWIHVSPYLRGRMFMFDLSQNTEKLADLLLNFPVGTRLMVTVAAVDAAKRSMDLISSPPVRNQHPGAGETILGVVHSKDEKKGSCLLQYGTHEYVRLNELDVDDYVHKESALRLLPEKGGFVYVKLVKNGDHLEACMRPSVTEVPHRNAKAAAGNKYKLSAHGAPLQVGEIVAGRVRGFKDGLFVSLGGGRVARCPIRLISDEFLETEEIGEEFPVGKRIQCRVTAVDEKSGRVEVSLKKSMLMPGPLISWNNIAVGQVVHCDVNQVKPYGLFLIVRGGEKVAGLAHRSEIFDQAGEDHQAVYNKGDYVIAKVTKVDKEAHRIGFTLKNSAFTAAELAENDSDSDSDDPEDQESNDKSESDDSSDNEEDSGADLAPPAVGTGLPSVGFGMADEDDEDEEDYEGNVEDVVEEEAKKSQKNKKKRERSDSKTIEAAELKLAKREAVPEKDEDFERALMGQPHSSEIWLRWMALKLSQGDVASARDIAGRALGRISSAHRRERQNVYVAQINLEVAHGNEEALEKAVASGAKECGRFEMDCKVLDALERGKAKPERIEAVVTRMLKKHSALPACWLRVGKHYIRSGKSQQSSELLQRAVRSLNDVNDKVLLTSSWAQAEFREGSIERGRTIFMGLLDNYPKRIDILVVFLDMEERAQAWEDARDLYKRATSLSISSKKMKYFLKRWMAFEKLHGDEQDLQVVMDTAKRFVDSKTQE